MKNILMIFTLAIAFIFTSLCLSQEGIHNKKDIDNLIQKHKHPHSMKSAPWDRFQDIEKSIGRHIPDLDRYQASLIPQKYPWLNGKSPSESGNVLQSQHNPSNQNETTDSANIAWVRNYGAGLVPSNDYAQATTVDSLGNVYVTGYSFGSITGNDYATIKYDKNGDTVWVRRYNGPGDGDDEACAIAVDGSGSVYVTGKSMGSGTDYDYATIKYNSNGDMVWLCRYIGTGYGYSSDYARALTIDAHGNVYVTGYSLVDGTYTNFATIKYDANGGTVWVGLYHSPINADDEPTALAVDWSGNLYVTGRGIGSGTGDDYTTIKYDASGDTVWVRRYNGPGNGDDGALALTIDAYGNVYVTGYSLSSGSSSAYATIKYSSNGDTDWVRQFNGEGNKACFATAIGVDSAGNVYVTGSSNRFYATIKYNDKGDSVWLRQYNGSVNGYNYAYALVLDSTGNVYVSGMSVGSGTDFDYATIKYTAIGDTEWIRRYNGSGNGNDDAFGLAVDRYGDVIVSGYTAEALTAYDYTTIKYSAIGDTDWVRMYNGPGYSKDYAAALARDGSGNVYVTGYSVGFGTNDDYETIKYNPSGDTEWVRRYNGIGNFDDEATAIAVDSSGNVYVTGGSDKGVASSSFDYVTVKYDMYGDTMWVRDYNGPGNSWDQASSIALDHIGNVYVTGFSTGNGTYTDYATIKYDANGDVLWIRRYSGPGNMDDVPIALVLDDSDNVYVTGGSVGTGGYFDYATIKYTSNGDLIWLRRYDPTGNSDASPTAFAVDKNSNVYVTGPIYSAISGLDYGTIKYTSNGDLAWVRRYHGNGDRSDFSTSLAMDFSGNVIVTGTTYGYETLANYTTVKYDTNGDTLWIRQYNGPGNSDDYTKALVVDSAGNIYVTGYSNQNFATIKYTAGGELMWTRIEPGHPYGEPRAVAVDNNGNLYVAGSSYGTENVVYTTIKYTQTPEGVKEQTLGAPRTFALRQNYPNPFNPTTRLSFVLSHSSLVTLKVYDILGKEVATLLNNKKYAIGSYEVPFDASKLSTGVYFYKLEAEDVGNSGNSFTQVKKMVLMK